MELKQIQRYPRLATVMMVEEFIKEHSAEFKVYQLWKHLPKKTMYQTFKTILAYLLEINKIAIDSDGKIVYIWSPDYKRKKELRWA